MFFRKGALVLFLLTGIVPIAAQQQKPALIFSGAAGDNYAIDLEKYNRIYFGESGMKLVDSNNPADNMDVLYAAYHKFRVGEAYISGLEDVSDVDSPLVYNPIEQTLAISGDSEDTYRIGVFGLNGMLMLSGLLNGTETISVESLPKGVYIAVAVGNKSNKTLKFLKK